MMSQVWSVSKYSHKSSARGRVQGAIREGGGGGVGGGERRGHGGGAGREGRGQGTVTGSSSQPSQASAAAANESVTQCCLRQCWERVYLSTAPLNAL